MYWLIFVLILLLCSSAPAQEAEQLRERREKMVKQQIKGRGVRDASVLKAMATVQRHLFVPASQAGEAYSDRPLPIGYGQTISQPYMVAYMTEVIKPGPSAKALEVGTGSGYQAAVLAEIMQQVYTH